MRAFPLAVLCGLGLVAAGCDLRHLPERMECRAADDWSACRALSDICIADGGPRCVGAEDSACASACLPADDGTRCAVDFDAESACGAQGFVSALGEFNGARFETDWNLLPLDREIWEPRAGRAIDQTLLAEMTPRQRRAVCATARTLDATGRSPCTLVWDERRGQASCERLADPCAECRLEATDFRCIPKNLCSDVICF